MTPKQKAEKLHRKVNTFILTCVGEDGYPLTKAVVPGKHRESLKELFFCTNTSSKFAATISEEPKIQRLFLQPKTTDLERMHALRQFRNHQRYVTQTEILAEQIQRRIRGKSIHRSRLLCPEIHTNIRQALCEL